jgi:transcriptional regulator GlxA family with amidase domain
VIPAGSAVPKPVVAILVFEGVEVLDFSGPFEVFAVSSQLHHRSLFEVGLVAEDVVPMRAANDLIITPNWRYREIPAPDVLVVPGGGGSRRAMADQVLRHWVTQAASGARVVLSVCGGARIVGACGLLDDLDATTHHKAFEEVEAIAPRARIRRGERIVDSGRIVSTGGVSAGIDGAFHVVSRLYGAAVARRTAEHMEYPWPPHGDTTQFPADAYRSGAEADAGPRTGTAWQPPSSRQPSGESS